MCRELRPLGLQALLMDAAVWLVADDDVAYKLDTLCFGNVDGGAGTAAAVRAALQAGGAPCQPGERAVRLSLDEAFFMAYALGILAVHEAPEPGGGGAAARLDDTARGRLGEGEGAWRRWAAAGGRLELQARSQQLPCAAGAPRREIGAATPARPAPPCPHP